MRRRDASGRRTNVLPLNWSGPIHPLAVEWREGTRVAQVREIAEALLHRKDGQ